MKNNNNRGAKKSPTNKGCKRDADKVSKFDSYDRRRGSHDNDPSWYASNPELLRDAATLSFPYAVGAEIPVAEEGAFSTLRWNAMAQPGVMSIRYGITPGISDNATSAVNTAAINLYSYVRHANSGHANYESADLMQYILCMDWLYAWYAELVRAYGVARTYSLKNRYMPKIYLQALGFDADDIINHLADLRYYINYLCVRLGAFAVPSNFSYMARHIWMSSHIWADAPGNRFQAYVYRLGTYGKYAPYESETGGEIRHITTGGDLITFEGIDQITSAMLDPIMTNEDFGIMSGDILKAFGTNIVTLSPIAEDYTVIPEYNLEVLEQIHNSMIGVGTPTKITQQNGVLITNQTCNLGADWAGDLGPDNAVLKVKTYLDMFSEYPDPGAVMVATRNMVAFTRDTDPRIISCGSEMLIGAEILVYNYEGGDLNVINLETPYVSFTTEIGGDATSLQNKMTAALNARSLLEQFAHHPPLINIVGVANEDESYVECLGKSWDTTNITEVSEVTLRKLHDTALMSQLNVPSMGAFALSR